MIRFAAVLAIAGMLAGCATKDVTASCQETQALASSPLVALAPPDLQLVATGVKVGSLVCGSHEYAAARDKLVAFIRSKTP